MGVKNSRLIGAGPEFTQWVLEILAGAFHFAIQLGGLQRGSFQIANSEQRRVCFVGATASLERLTELIVGIRLVRIQFDCALQHRDGLGRFVQFQLGFAEIKVGGPRVRAGHLRPFEMRDTLGKLALLNKETAEEVTSLTIAGICFERGVQLAKGVVRAT